MKTGKMLAAVAAGLSVAVTPLATAAADTPDRPVPEGMTVSTPHEVGVMEAETCRSNHQGSYVCFDPDGDHFWVKDTERDGTSAAVYYQTNYGRTGHCINSAGASIWVDCDLDMRENYLVTFWAVNVDVPTWNWFYWSAEQSAVI